MARDRILDGPPHDKPARHGATTRAETGDAADAAPVDALLAAVRAYDGGAILGALAPAVRLSIPPLRIHIQGARDVTQAIWAVIYAFDQLTYQPRSRFLSPTAGDQPQRGGAVTDEAVLTGIHTRELLGAAATHRVGTVPVRLMARHDGVSVTSLELWPDVAAVRALCDELAQHIDERRAGSAGAMISALRATIPAGESKVLFGNARQVVTAPVSAAADADLLAASPVRDHGLTEGVKAPVTRRVRRLRAVAAGAAMLTVSGLIIGWVANGAMRSGTATALGYPNASPTSQSRSGQSGSGQSGSGQAGAGQAGAGQAGSAQAGSGNSGSGQSGSGSAGSQNGAATGSGTPASPSAPPAALASATVPAVAPPIVNDRATIPSDLLFDTGKAVLTAPARATLAALIRKIVTDGRSGTITVRGFTDSVGTKADNLRLSKARARAVAAALSAGLPGVRINSEGYGESRPVDTNSTDAGRHNNRHVTVILPPARR